MNKQNNHSRLDFLGNDGTGKAQSTEKYTRLVKLMRLVLPTIALAIVVVVVSWSKFEDLVAKPAMEAAIPHIIGKNELLRPRFQSVDNKNQPFKITAHRAFQNEQNPKLVHLDRPMADITLNSGNWLAIESKKGTYEQNAENLVLEDDVKLYHDEGYELITSKLFVNLKAQEAWSDQPIYAQGPAGQIEASGMKADTGKGELIFTGPVTLKLNKDVKGL